MKRWLYVATVALAFVGCQTLVEEPPTSPSGATPGASIPTSPNAPVVVVPVPIPSAAAPAPAPNPTPTPNTPAPNNPTPAPPAQTQGCGLPPGKGPGDDCPRGQPTFLDEVESALTRTIAEHPEVFDLKDGGPCGNCYRVKDVGAYEKYVVQNLTRQGLCAVAGEEFGIKNTNNFNDQFDLLTSDLHIRRQGGSYRGTCRPAAF
jgi:hypothetical protein